MQCHGNRVYRLGQLSLDLCSYTVNPLYYHASRVSQS